MNNKPTVNGIPCNPGRVIGDNGHYIVRFDKADTTLEQVEAIDWEHPVLENAGDNLPSHYGYEVENISYLYRDNKFVVLLKVQEQYLGDVSGYQAEISDLESSLATTQAEKAAAQAQAQQAESAAAAAQAQVTVLESSLESAQADAAQAQENVAILAGKAVTDGAEARVMRMTIETAVVSLPDESAAQTPSLSQAWTVGEEVEPGDRRYYAPTGLLYKVRDGQGHTTQENWTPDKTPALWAVVDVTHAGTAEDPIPAARGMDYVYGKYYSDPEDGKLYLCKRIGEEDGGTINLQYLPHELIGQYFDEVGA